MELKNVFALFAVYFCVDHKTTAQVQENTTTNRPRRTLRPPSWDPLWNGQHRPFNPAWMEYCNPLNCNAYHKTSCGLNRNSMRFKYFQSDCHIILNNKCAAWRGNIKYDIIDIKYCYAYVMQVRSRCPHYCERAASPVCAVKNNGSVEIFQNDCYFDKANCATVIPEFEEVKMDICEHYLGKGDRSSMIK